MLKVMAIVLFAISFPTEAGASGPEVDGKLLLQLNRFSTIYECKSPGAESVAKLAEELLESIRELKDPAIRKILRLYESECCFALDRIDEAKTLATRIVQDKASMDGPEAARLLLKIEQVEESKRTPDAQMRDFVKRSLRSMESIARFYPKGLAAARLLWFSESKDIVGVLPDGSRMSACLTRMHFYPKVKDYLMTAAGRLYLEMNMCEDAIRAGRLAVGMMDSDDWISERCAGKFPHMKARGNYVAVWECMGDAHSRLGQWEKALECYYKAVASGDSLENLGPKLQSTWRDLRKGKKPTPPAPKPDRVRLEEISKYCIETDLFDEALHAAEAAAAVEDRPNRELFARIFTEKARVLEKCLRDYNAGSRFRGTIISQASVDKVRQQVRKWSPPTRSTTENKG